MAMKSWHIVVIDGAKIHYQRQYFYVDEAKVAEAAKKAELADLLASVKTMRVLREYY